MALFLQYYEFRLCNVGYGINKKNSNCNFELSLSSVATDGYICRVFIDIYLYKKEM